MRYLVTSHPRTSSRLVIGALASCVAFLAIDGRAESVGVADFALRETAFTQLVPQDAAVIPLNAKLSAVHDAFEDASVNLCADPTASEEECVGTLLGMDLQACSAFDVCVSTLDVGTLEEGATLHLQSQTRDRGVSDRVYTVGSTVDDTAPDAPTVRDLELTLPSGDYAVTSFYVAVDHTEALEPLIAFYISRRDGSPERFHVAALTEELENTAFFAMNPTDGAFCLSASLIDVAGNESPRVSLLCDDDTVPPRNPLNDFPFFSCASTSSSSMPVFAFLALFSLALRRATRHATRASA